VKNLKYLRLVYYSIQFFFIIGCVGNKIIAPAPDVYKISSELSDQELVGDSSSDSADLIDFSLAIPDIADSEDSTINRVDSLQVFSRDSCNENLSITSTGSTLYPLFKVSTKSVRVVLSEKASQFNIYSTGVVTLHSKGRLFTPLHGRIHFQKKTSEIVSIENGGITREVFLPCTVVSVDKYNFIDYDEKSYRGSFALFSDPDHGLLLVNIVDIEEYLRGVVPLELGKWGAEEIEALKAQAVAARTYTYRRISERKSVLFDLYSTVKDQVYGGANVEYLQADIAVKSTRDVIITSGDSIIYAYYHSTCGGKTASIENVWPQKSPKPYLISVSDIDSMGKSYCSLSNYYTWRELWQSNQLKSILLKNLSDNCENDKSKIHVGDFKLRIIDKFECGRVKTLLVEGNGWRRKIVADKTRYVLRRGTSDFPILRSANFNIVSCTSNDVVISGKGYGHGVGMCQMGAVGRARAGQKFEEILKVYYTGVQLSICTCDQ
jgi:stage II sporulation protein D